MSGGARTGAGRHKGAKSAVVKLHQATIAELARTYSDIALQALVQIATSGASESARVSAANSILDRAFGKPAQAVEVTGKDGGAVVFHVVSDDVGLL